MKCGKDAYSRGLCVTSSRRI